MHLETGSLPLLVLGKLGFHNLLEVLVEPLHDLLVSCPPRQVLRLLPTLHQRTVTNQWKRLIK